MYYGSFIGFTSTQLLENDVLNCPFYLFLVPLSQLLLCES